jgi:hypothetical protein
MCIRHACRDLQRDFDTWHSWPKEQRFIVGAVVGLIAGGVGCIFVLIGVAGIMLGVMHLLGAEHASNHVFKLFLLGTYVVYGVAVTYIGAIRLNGGFLPGFLVSRPVGAIWLMIAWVQN